jgi:hypothetical protein
MDEALDTAIRACEANSKDLSALSLEYCFLSFCDLGAQIFADYPILRNTIMDRMQELEGHPSMTDNCLSAMKKMAYIFIEALSCESLETSDCDDDQWDFLMRLTSDEYQQ